MIGSYVHDTIANGDYTLERNRKLTERNFESNVRSYGKFTFAVIQVEKMEGGFKMTQERFANKIASFSTCSDY